MLTIQLILDDKWCCCMSACYRCSWSLSTSIYWWCHEQWKSFEVHCILVLLSAILVHRPKNFLISFPLFFFLFYWFTGHKPAQWEQAQRVDYIPCEVTHHHPPPPPPPLVVRSLILQPKEDGGRSVKVLWDGAYGFFISLRGIEWLINHSWASVERLSHQWVTLTANGRLRLRISQNRKWADENSLKQFSWRKITWNTFFYIEEKFNTSKGKTWSRGTSWRLPFAVCCKRDSKSLYYRWSGRKSILGLLAPKSGT